MPVVFALVDQLGSTPYFVLSGYLLLLLFLGWQGYRRSRSGEEDYYLASRGQGWIVSGLSIMATFFSSFALLGAPGMAYREGVVFALFSLNVPVAGLCVYLLGARIWQIGRAKSYVTPADMVSDYYDSRVLLRLLVATAGFLYLVPYVMMQIKAGGVLSAELFDGKHAFEIGCVLLAGITTAYIMIGGMRSVAWTDVIQGVLLMSGMFLAGLAMVFVLGGFGSFGSQLTSKLKPESLTVPGATGSWPWPMLFTVCILASSGSMVQPAQWMRYYSAQSRETLRRAAVIFAVVLPACFLFGVMMVGVGGQILYPHQTDEAGNRMHNDRLDQDDQVLVVFLKDQLPELLGVGGILLASLVIVAIMAASMSTADSSLHAMSAVAVRDVYDRFMRPTASERERVLVGRGVIVLATLVAVVLVIINEWHGRDTGKQYTFMAHIALMGFMAISFSAQLLPLTLDMLFLRRGTRVGAAAGLTVGLLAAFVFGQLFTPMISAFHQIPQLTVSADAPLAAWQQAADAGEPLLVQGHFLVAGLKKLIPIHASAWGLLFNLPVFVLLSLVTSKVSRQRREEYQRLLAADPR